MRRLTTWPPKPGCGDARLISTYLPLGKTGHSVFGIYHTLSTLQSKHISTFLRLYYNNFRKIYTNKKEDEQASLILLILIYYTLIYITRGEKQNEKGDAPQ